MLNNSLPDSFLDCFVEVEFLCCEKFNGGSLAKENGFGGYHASKTRRGSWEEEDVERSCLECVGRCILMKGTNAHLN